MSSGPIADSVCRWAFCYAAARGLKHAVIPEDDYLLVFWSERHFMFTKLLFVVTTEGWRAEVSDALDDYWIRLNGGFNERRTKS